MRPRRPRRRESVDVSQPERDGAGGPGRPAAPAPDPALSPTGRVFRPVVLMVLDGWGHAQPGPGNAVELAHTPAFDELLARWPHGVLEASGLAVGLPAGQMGNSEVGHLNIGAGRVVYQELTRITHAIEVGEFLENEVLKDALAAARERGSTFHLMGLVSAGGVHSDLGHLEACLEMARREGVTDVVVHAFLDGRDTPPRSAGEYLAEVADAMAALGVGRFGTVIGRYYAMDRDSRWDRVKLAYDAMVHGEGERAPDAQSALALAYARDENDEFVRPTVVGDDRRALVKDGDSCLFFNFRPDRARELTRAFTEPGFDRFDLGPQPPRVTFTTMTQYKKEFPLPVAFPPEGVRHVLAEVLAELGLRQLHMAETEKYAHVTFFFNGGVEHEVAGEKRILIPSPRDVATYDEKPQMSAFEVADELVIRLGSDEFDFVVVNFANADMVGHSGVLEAAVAAVEAVDACVGRVVETVLSLGGVCLVTADHGNSDSMVDTLGGPDTAHSTNPVPFIATVDGVRVRDGGILADIAPTVLHLLGYPAPPEMTGRDLLEPAGPA